MNLFPDLVHHHIYRGIEAPLTARAYDYVLAGNGLFKRARSLHLAARIPVVSAHIAGLPDLEPAIQLVIRPGLIPGRLLYTILTDARRHAYAGCEQMYRFQFVPRSAAPSLGTPEGQGGFVVTDDVTIAPGFAGSLPRDGLPRYPSSRSGRGTPRGLTVVRIVRPDQEAGAASIRYDAGGDQDGVICDLHSHHTMHAFFSATDDCDEGGFRFYAVVGQVLARPEIRLRLGMYGDFVSLPITALFTPEQSPPAPQGSRGKGLHYAGFTGAGPFVDLYQETEAGHDDV